jgi:hypothetical protein
MEIGVCEKCGSATIDGHCRLCNPKKSEVQSRGQQGQLELGMAVLYGVGLAVLFWILTAVLGFIGTLLMIPAVSLHVNSFIGSIVGVLMPIVCLAIIGYLIFKLFKKYTKQFAIVTLVSAAIAIAVPFVIIQFLIANTV